MTKEKTLNKEQLSYDTFKVSYNIQKVNFNAICTSKTVDNKDYNR